MAVTLWLDIQSGFNITIGYVRWLKIMNSKHHYTKFINVSQLLGAQYFHLDSLTRQVETLLGLLDLQDEGSALQNIGNYLSVNSMHHSRRPEFSSAPLQQPHTSH